jgi:hypothetical protein
MIVFSPPRRFAGEGKRPAVTERKSRLAFIGCFTAHTIKMAGISPGHFY